MRIILKNFKLFGVIFLTLLLIGNSSAEEAKRGLQKKPAKKKSAWFFNWFSKETGLISVANPPKETLDVLSLDDCINIAIKNHLPLQIADKNVKLAEMRLWESRRNMLPTVSARWEESYGKVDARRYVGKKEYVEGQQAVFHGGELYFTMKQAEVNLKIVKKDHGRIKNDLILQVKKGYYTLVKAKENLKIQAELSGEVDKTFDMVTRAFDAGAISKLEFLNVSSQASQVKFQLASARGDESVAELILKQAMNVDSKERIEIEPDIEFKKFDIDFDDTLKLAFRNRPEMLINSMMVDYYKYEKDIAKAKGWPKVDIMGSWGLGKEEYISEDNQAKADG
ncbi:MAG: TolC family protein, partial [Candidatus Omnitrophota bacterium]|nr:TolC family protein [Candidatus Omnitrophota bacterium]